MINTILNNNYSVSTCYNTAPVVVLMNTSRVNLLIDISSDYYLSHKKHLLPEPLLLSGPRKVFVLNGVIRWISGGKQYHPVYHL